MGELRVRRSGMATETIEFRDACFSEIDEIVKLNAAAFAANGRPASVWNRLRSDPAFQFTTQRVGVEAGKIVAALRVYWRTLEMGGASLPVGVIGDVAVAPDQQGRGLGQMLMNDAMDVLHARQAVMGRLAGAPSFYSRFGFFKARERRLVVPCEPLNSIPCSAGVISFDPADLTRDDQWLELWDEATQSCVSRVARQAEFGRWLLGDRGYHPAADGEDGPATMTIRVEGVLQAYALCKVSTEQVEIQECNWREGAEQAALTLLSEISKRFPTRKKVIVFTARMQQLNTALRENGVDGQISEDGYQPMVAFVKLTQWVARWAEQWQQREAMLAGRPMVLSVENEGRVLIAADGQVLQLTDAERSPDGAIAVELTQDQMFGLLMGYEDAAARIAKAIAGAGECPADSIPPSTRRRGVFSGLENA